MPLPQIKHKKNEQSWRDEKKRYYIHRKKETYANPSFKSKDKVISFRTSYFKRLKWPGFKKFITSGLMFKLIALSVLAVFVFLVAGYFWLARSLPDLNNLTERQLAQSTMISDRTGGTVLYEVHGEQRRTRVNLSEIPEHVKWATIAIEDKNFYKHGGISLWAIFRTTVTNILFGNTAGGSTLTQQFIKNAILTPEKKVTRKLKEWILAYRIEKKLSKDEILELYLNEIPYGSTAYGVEAASQMYFGKSVQDINLAEAAVLAALPQAPSRYSPYGSNKELLIGRQHYILDQMVEQGYTTEPKAEAAKQFELDFKTPKVQMLAPHFVMYVKEILQEKYGFTEKDIEQGGYKIQTSLDLYKQQIAEDVISEKAESNVSDFKATNAALVSIDPKTGQVLAMVGSKDYYSEEIDGQFNVATALRQPGSSLKPLVYATAFKKGYTPNTILYDVVTNFAASGNAYEPKNYDLQERGPVSIKKALAGSLNIPAVKAIYLAGIDNVINTAKDFGYTTLDDPERFGLSLVLGGGEVKLLEHTNAYGVFAREGFSQPINPILKIEDKDGKVVYEWKEEEPKRVLDGEIARMINNILTDNNARAYIFGTNNNLTLGSRPVGAKTGTTNDYRDAWTMGYTPSIVTGVWVGNNDNSPMNNAGGTRAAAPIWNEFMKRILGDTPIEQFNPWNGKKTGKAVIDGDNKSGEVVRIDKASGFLATEYTPESFVDEKVFRQDHCILYYVDKNNPLGPALKDPAADPQFNLWEGRVLAWSKKQMDATSTPATDMEPPTEYDNLHLPENRPTFEILSPGNNETITDSIMNVEIEPSAPRGVGRADYYINDNMIFSNNVFPYTMSKDVRFLNNGYHNLKVVVCDDIDNCSEKSLEFNLILDETVSDYGGFENVAIEWATPSGTTALTTGFPFAMNLKVSNYIQIARISVFSKSAESEPYAKQFDIQPISGDAVSGTWIRAPRPGTYKMYAEAYGWGGELKKSKEIIIIVKEPEATVDEN